MLFNLHYGQSKGVSDVEIDASEMTLTHTHAHTHLHKPERFDPRINTKWNCLWFKAYIYEINKNESPNVCFIKKKLGNLEPFEHFGFFLLVSLGNEKGVNREKKCKNCEENSKIILIYYFYFTAITFDKTKRY